MNLCLFMSNRFSAITMVRRKISNPREIINKTLFEDCPEVCGLKDTNEDIMADDELRHTATDDEFSTKHQNNTNSQHQHYCLRWNNYQTNMTSVFHQLLENEAFVDVTLACKDFSLKAHKVVLSACSTYFQKLLMENPCKHPTIIMPQDVDFVDLKFIIEFVYRGEIDVSEEELQSLLRTADHLKIKGLCEVPTNGTIPLNDHKIELSPSPIISRRSYTKLQRVCSSNAKKRRYLLNSLTNEEDASEKKMPAVLMLESKSTPETNEAQIWSPLSGEHRAIDNCSGQTVSGLGHGMLPTPTLFPGHVELPPEPPAPTATPVPCPPPDFIPNSQGLQLTHCSSPPTHHDLSDTTMSNPDENNGSNHNFTQFDDVKVKFETLRSVDSAGEMDACSRLSQESSESMHHQSMMITPHLLDMNSDSNHHSNKMNGHSSQTYHMLQHNSLGSNVSGHGGGPKTWSQEDMELALDALRNHNMSLTKASATYGIPSTTLWQRAHRLGIDTPKKEGPTKSWTEDSLNSALEALRTGTISANKASKAYGIPSSTLYKIARREGIRLAAPFNAAPTTWSPEDLERALESIRTGQTSVQRASTEFGIPTGTLYGRCKREGIELSRSNPTPWSEDAMGEALEAVRVGQMSINQAAIHYNLPYSSLYGRFKRGKYENDSITGPGGSILVENNLSSDNTSTSGAMLPTSERQMLQQYNNQQNQHHHSQQQSPHQSPHTDLTGNTNYIS